jgi:hypothetical protein
VLSGRLAGVLSVGERESVRARRFTAMVTTVIRTQAMDGFNMLLGLVQPPDMYAACRSS